MIPAYPLEWPVDFPRTKVREKGSFRTSLTAALNNVETSIRLFARDSGKDVKDVVLSSNVTLGAHRPADPGVAAYFMWDGLAVAIPVDRYTTVEANLQAIHHVIEARRVELRHGTLALVRASMLGLVRLPAPKTRPWRVVLGLVDPVTPDQVARAYRIMAVRRHPDRAGGSEELMAELNVARDQALKELGHV